MRETNKNRDHLQGRGSADLADALKGDLFLSIQRCSQAVPDRSLPPIAGIGKVGELERAIFHPHKRLHCGAIGGKKISQGLWHGR
jgi:hypothetical protein